MSPGHSSLRRTLFDAFRGHSGTRLWEGCGCISCHVPLGVRGGRGQRRGYPKATPETPGPVVPLSPRGGRPTQSRKREHPLPVRPVMAATSSRHRPPQLTHSPRHQTGLPHGAGTAPGSAQDQGVTGQFLRRSHARSRFPLNLPSATRSCPRRIPAFWKGGPRVARRGADVSGGSKRVLAARDPALLTAVGGSLGLVCLGCVGGTLPRVFGY